MNLKKTRDKQDYQFGFMQATMGEHDYTKSENEEGTVANREGTRVWVTFLLRKKKRDN